MSKKEQESFWIIQNMDHGHSWVYTTPTVFRKYEKFETFGNTKQPGLLLNKEYQNTGLHGVTFGQKRTHERKIFIDLAWISFFLPFIPSEIWLGLLSFFHLCIHIFGLDFFSSFLSSKIWFGFLFFPFRHLRSGLDLFSSHFVILKLAWISFFSLYVFIDLAWIFFLRFCLHSFSLDFFLPFVSLQIQLDFFFRPFKTSQICLDFFFLPCFNRFS